MKYIDLRIDESSDRTIQGRWEFDRVRGGVLQVPASSSFPTSSYAGELFWNEISGALYVRNQLNNDWIFAGAPSISASYITISNTGSLTSERSIATSTDLLGVDAGANSSYTVSINNNVVATVSGTTFSGPILANDLSGSLQKTTSGLSYLVAGSGIGVVSSSVGQIILTNFNTSSSGADSAATYATLASETSLLSGRVLTTSGSGITAVDNGALLILNLSSTGSVPASSSLTYNGHGVAVNDRGFVTSGSTTWFGQNFAFITGSSAEPFSNATTTYRACLSLTGTNLTSGIYRFGWCYVFYTASTSVSLKFRCTVHSSASFDVMEEISELGANERHIRSGHSYVQITNTTASFDLQMATESGTAASLVYDRALEFWRVS